MTEQGLREKIDDIIFRAKMEQGEEPKYRNQILALTAAHYKEKYAGYVKLDKDPLYPENVSGTGWREVKE